MAEAVSDLREKQVDALSFIAGTPGNTDTKAKATAALGRLGFWIRDGRAVIVEESDIPPLVALVTNGSNPDGQQEAVTALANIALNAAIRAKIVAAGGIAALVALMRKGNTRCQAEAAWALDILARDDIGAVDSAANRAAIVDAAAVDPLVALLTNGSTGDREQAARELANLASCDTIQEAIADAGAIPPLVELVSNGAAGGQDEAARALLNLASNDANIALNASIRAAIVAAGGIEVLVALVMNGSDGGKLYAGWALEKLPLAERFSRLQSENASLKRRLDRVIAAAQVSDSEEQPPQKRARG